MNSDDFSTGHLPAPEVSSSTPIESSLPQPTDETEQGGENRKRKEPELESTPESPADDSDESKRTCAICLTTLKAGNGHAIFTAECSHAFHFHCIATNVKHGNQICPVCRAKWKDIPFQNPFDDLSRRRTRSTQELAWPNLQQPLPQPAVVNQNIYPLFHVSEPAVFDDDEPVNAVTQESSSINDLHTNPHSIGPLEAKTYPEMSAISRSVARNDFAILIHLKATITSERQSSRVPVDLVTVLDVSGSMAGNKIALLKRAMGFLIQNLGPSDRLSVVAFSSTAQRVFPLRRMSDIGKQEALQAVNSLGANGGTNIAEGLKKGAKVLTDSKSKNPVSSIILLSDGQDTYTLTSHRIDTSVVDYSSLLPPSMHLNNDTGPHIPVHTFGFGTDHDPNVMHAISETSGGTFSFIEAESVIQDAFAQCIGGLLSVVVQELRVLVECLDPNVKLSSIKAGSYKTSIESSDARSGYIDVGDLYAEEERDYIVTMNIPASDVSSDDMSLLKVKCTHRDPLTKEIKTFEGADDVKILRPESTGEEIMVSMVVDRQRNRFKAAEAISEARSAAERGDLTAAVRVLERCCNELCEAVGYQSGDQMCVGLVAELKEMEERMANRHVYESSGRAYVLSGLSSHSRQRATARGDSMELTAMTPTYQTPTMASMVSLSRSPASRQAPFPARPPPGN